MDEVSAISGVGLTSTTPHTPPQPESLTSEARALTRSVAAAVQVVNTAGLAGENREVTFSFDQATRAPVVKVVDTASREVITQWPPEYLLEMAADAKRTMKGSG